jgi:hypothetical protein
MKKCGIMPPNILDPHPFGSGTVCKSVPERFSVYPFLQFFVKFLSSKWPNVTSCFVYAFRFHVTDILLKETEPLLAAMCIFLGSDPEIQGFGSVFIFYGSGSSGSGWRPIRIQGFNDHKLKKNNS